ncbi:hypothetical protein J1G18_24810 [Pseudomonas sp. MIS38]|jgi:hypothetical protein|uniref:hypothetical protein n=1 Tax=Pseudomonas sp. MIS38 TaxID=91465 RepID=UPI001CA6BB91|nr:hypothetical protein [Pseudomonas sp. MIS38]MBY8960525.1 hypothetical protein [Pseudomonas sp. MIS38]
MLATRLADKLFEEFLLLLNSSGLLSAESLEMALSDLGGTQGVVGNAYYISAYELLGSALVSANSFQSVLIFFKDFQLCLGEGVEQRYYFVESVVDCSSARGDNVAALIQAAPSNYRVYLRAKFQQQNNKGGLLKESGKTA